MDRDQVLAIIDQAYAARQANDEEALGNIWAEDATFELAGETACSRTSPAPRVPRPASLPSKR